MDSRPSNAGRPRNGTASGSRCRPSENLQNPIVSGPHDVSARGPVLDHALSALPLRRTPLRRRHSPAAALLRHDSSTEPGYFGPSSIRTKEPSRNYGRLPGRGRPREPLPHRRLNSRGSTPACQGSMDRLPPAGACAHLDRWFRRGDAGPLRSGPPPRRSSRGNWFPSPRRTPNSSGSLEEVLEGIVHLAHLA